MTGVKLFSKMGFKFSYRNNGTQPSFNIANVGIIVFCLNTVFFLFKIIIHIYMCIILGQCDVCQRSNHLRKTPSVLHPVPTPDKSFTQFGVDLIGPFPTTAAGNKYIIVVTDYLTKWPAAAPLPSKEAHVVTSFITSLICRYRSRSTIITDQGARIL